MENRENDIITVFEFWNDSKIIEHRELSKFTGVIAGRLNFYSVSELCQAIRNYKDILSSDGHWFNYAWTLDQFLTRKNALDNFIDRGIALNKYKKRTSQFDRGESTEDSADFYRAINREEIGGPDVLK